jgi:endonuclease/exonuclease/phosphatase family metal-dependent hydrolase
VETWDLGQMCRDPTRRSAIAVEVVTGEPDAAQRRRMLVVGTHLSHLRQGSRIQLARLRQMLASRNGPVVPAVLAGDMNLPGPPLLAFLPGWKRAVRGRTWPAWCPVAQSDHILFTAAVTGTGEVLPIRGSDHLPVRARLSFT